MSMTTRFRWLPLFLLCLTLAAPSRAADATAGPLVDVDWLAKHLGRPDLVLLDASPAPLHAAKHVAGAIGADFLTYGFPERPLADMEQRYRSWGLSPGKTVVIYDQGGTYLATRLFFALYHHGFPAANLHVLDGGLAKWEERQLPVTTDPTPAPAAGSFRIEQVREDVRVRLPEFLAATGDPANNVMLEALGPDWHFGELVFFGRPGHVPHATMAPPGDFFNADKTFKSPDEIRRMMAYLGVKPSQRIHAHCGGGIAASVPFFALKFLAGYPSVTLFQESLMGWFSDPRQLPAWTYDAPALLRDADWLQAWGGQRLRAFIRPDLSIVDVRPATAYAQGHVPYAVNVGPDEFRRHLGAPARLAGPLGAAGVDAAHEVVIASGGGLTKDAALAFLLLEALGQKRTSILMETMEAWAARGLPVAKDATVVGKPANAREPAVPPATYVPAPREGTLIADPGATRGAYPKVYVASGEQLPSAVPEGRLVHLPYTSLLDAAGRPKPASAIWAALTKAGVTRYGEFVLVADDPADAAVNYVVFRLMGFPDVKVLAR